MNIPEQVKNEARWLIEQYGDCFDYLGNHEGALPCHSPVRADLKTSSGTGKTDYWSKMEKQKNWPKKEII